MKTWESMEMVLAGAAGESGSAAHALVRCCNVTCSHPALGCVQLVQLTLSQLENGVGDSGLHLLCVFSAPELGLTLPLPAFAGPLSKLRSNYTFQLRNINRWKSASVQTAILKRAEIV
jgi:hypothetical protein